MTIAYIDSFMLNGDMTTDMSLLIARVVSEIYARISRFGKTRFRPCAVTIWLEIIAEKGGMQIKTNGRALQDGALNDMIRVQNIRSQRIISAVVSAVGQVKVEM